MVKCQKIRHKQNPTLPAGYCPRKNSKNLIHMTDFLFGFFVGFSMKTCKHEKAKYFYERFHKVLRDIHLNPLIKHLSNTVILGNPSDTTTMRNWCRDKERNITNACDLNYSKSH